MTTINWESIRFYEKTTTFTYILLLYSNYVKIFILQKWLTTSYNFAVLIKLWTIFHLHGGQFLSKQYSLLNINLHFKWMITEVWNCICNAIPLHIILLLTVQCYSINMHSTFNWMTRKLPIVCPKWHTIHNALILCTTYLTYSVWNV